MRSSIAVLAALLLSATAYGQSATPMPTFSADFSTNTISLQMFGSWVLVQVQEDDNSRHLDTLFVSKQPKWHTLRMRYDPAKQYSFDISQSSYMDAQMLQFQFVPAIKMEFVSEPRK